MKIRRGFVSNSSSSSFCCFTTQEIDKKAQATLTEEQRQLLAKVLEYYNLGKMTLIGYESSSTDYCSYIGPYNTEEDSEEFELADTAVDAWKHAVKEVGEENPLIEVDIDL